MYEIPFSLSMDSDARYFHNNIRNEATMTKALTGSGNSSNRRSLATVSFLLPLFLFMLLVPAAARADVFPVDFRPIMQYCHERFYALAGVTVYNPATADHTHTGGLGILDADEFSLLSLVLGNPSAPNHDAVQAEFVANQVLARAAIGAPIIGLTTSPYASGPMQRQPIPGTSPTQYYAADGVMAAYICMGEWDWYIETMQEFKDSAFGGSVTVPASQDGYYLRNDLSMCGDFDADGVRNCNEYWAQGSFTAALEPSVIEYGSTWSVVPCMDENNTSYRFKHNPANQHIYMFTSPMTWSDAQSFAESLQYLGRPMPGRLCAIGDAAENNWIWANMTIDETAWIGATDAGNDIGSTAPNPQDWLWVNGEPMIYTNWRSGEPNGVDGFEDYATMRNDGTWNDLAATVGTPPELRLLPAVIELTGEWPDVDGDGTPDAFENTVYVDADNMSGIEDGMSWATAFTTLQMAAAQAVYVGGGEVWVAEGTYTVEPGADPYQPVLTMAPGAHFYGGFSGVETQFAERDWTLHLSVIDGEDAYKCVVGSDGSTLDGFTLTRGYQTTAEWPYSCGSAMLNLNASPYVRNCAIVNSVSFMMGGAVYNYGGNPVFAKCTFSNNVATYAFGGAIANESSSTSLVDCVFITNQAYAGGAIYNYNSQTSLQNCIFTGNGAEVGGAIQNEFYGFVQAVNCTFYGNDAGLGSAIEAANWSNSQFHNCIVWGAGPSVSCDIISATDISYSDVYGGYPGLCNINAAPLFVDAGYDFHLQEGSPCIDAGSDTIGPSVDIEGNPRPFGWHTDMGAYESPYWGPEPAGIISLDNPAVEVSACPGTKAFQSFLVRNIGPGVLAIDSIYCTNNIYNSDDTFTSPGPEMPIILGSGGTAEVEIIFAPSADGTFSDTIVILSNDPSHPRLEVPVYGYGTHVCSMPPCPITPTFESEGQWLCAYYGRGDYYELDHDQDGILDSFEFAMLGEALCNYAYPYHQQAVCAFSSNLAMMIHDVQDFTINENAYTFAACLTVDAAYQATTMGDMNFIRPYTYLAGDPFGSNSDVDGDGVTNLAEFNNVFSLAGSSETARALYLQCVLDPGLDGSYIPPSDIVVLDSIAPEDDLSVPLTVCPLSTATATLSLQNVSNSLAIISGIYSLYDGQIGAGNPFYYATPIPTPVLLRPGETCSIGIYFSLEGLGSFEDTLSIFSNDADAPQLDVAVSGSSDYASCAAPDCPMMPMLDQEGYMLYDAMSGGDMIWASTDYDENGMADSWEVALVAQVLCDPSQPLYLETLSTYLHNLQEAQRILGQYGYAGYFDYLWAAMAMVSAGWNEIVFEEFEEGDYRLVSGNPFAAASDADGDGVSNYDEYVNTRCAGGAREQFAACALDPACDGLHFDGAALSVRDSDAAVFDRSVEVVGCPGGGPLQSFVLQNVGSTMLTISAIYSAYDYYSIPDSPFAYTGLIDVPVVLAPGDSQLVEVTIPAETSGVWSDTLTVLSDDDDQPIQLLNVWAILDPALCCPLLPLWDQEGVNLAGPNDWWYLDFDGNGLLDAWELGPLAEVLCDPSHPLHAKAMYAYAHNLALVRTNFYGMPGFEQVGALMAAWATLSYSLRDMAQMFTGIWEFNEIPHDPFRSSRDLDSDGYNNWDEYWNVQMLLGTEPFARPFYVQAVLDPSLNGTVWPYAGIEMFDSVAPDDDHLIELATCPYDVRSEYITVVNFTTTLAVIDSIYSIYDTYTGPGNPFGYSGLDLPVVLYPGESRRIDVTFPTNGQTGVFSDQVVASINGGDQTVALDLVGTSDYDLCDIPPDFTCPIWPIIDAEGAQWFALLVGEGDWYTTDADGNGMPDRWEVALLAQVLCDESAPHHAAALGAYVRNLQEARLTFESVGAPYYYDWFGRLWAALITANSWYLQHAQEEYGNYVGVPGDPFAPDADLDGDGTSNFDEYANIVAAGGSVDDYTNAAADPGNDGGCLDGTRLAVLDPDAPVWDRSFAFASCPSDWLVKKLMYPPTYT